MSKKAPEFIKIDNVADYHKALDLPKPQHPLLSVIDFSKTQYSHPPMETSILMNLYCISIKEGSQCVLRYGPHHYDFREGLMSFIKPGQIITVDPTVPNVQDGYSLVFHPDFVRSYELAKKMKTYNFFGYEVNEALFLSDKEKLQIRSIANGIAQEYDNPIDTYSQDAIVSFIDLLLVYGQRFYDRQFITRKSHNSSLISRFEQLLDNYFAESSVNRGLPQVSFFAEQLNMSVNYLSDMLRSTTGQSAQNHIQNKVIDEAKTLLSSSGLTVAEIAYHLGFEQPQSLNRLFKKKTDATPLEFRERFN